MTSPAFIELYENPPDKGDFLVSLTRKPIPVDKTRIKGKEQWFTYISIDPDCTGWFLDWNPNKGMRVLFHRNSFEAFYDWPWIEQARVISRNITNRAIYAEVT